MFAAALASACLPAAVQTPARPDADLDETDCPAPKSRRAGPPKHSRSNTCITRSDGTVLFHVTFTVEYDDPDTKPMRQMFEMRCEPDDTCAGVFVNVTPLYNGDNLGMFDVSRIDGARVLSRTGSVTIVQWGPLRTFTLDAAAGRVIYRESGQGQVEGQGATPCEFIEASAN